MVRELCLLMGLVLAGGAAAAQPGASLLARPVQPTLTNAPLARVLAELSRQSGVPFSYSSTRIGASRRCQLRTGAARPLGTVLHEVLGANHLSYGLLNGQLVLWPAAEPAPLGIAELNSLGKAPAPARIGRVAASETKPSGTQPAGLTPAPPQLQAASQRGRGEAGRLSKTAAVDPVPAALVPVRSAGSSAKLPGSLKSTVRPAEVGPGTAAAVAALAADAGGKGGAGSAPAPTKRKKKLRTVAAATVVAASAMEAGRRYRLTDEGMEPEAEPGRASTRRRKAGVKNSAAARASATEASGAVEELSPRLPSSDSSAAAATKSVPDALAKTAAPTPVTLPRVTRQRMVAQASLLPPLSSNGVANARTVNTFSLNVLAGYSAGVSLVEIGGIVNIVRDTVRGFQAAGIGNVTGTDVRGVQLAGIANVTGGSSHGIQGAGIVNVNRDDARGLQIAGIVNVTGGATRARHRPNQPTRLRRWLGVPRMLATDPLAQLPEAPAASQPGLLVQAAGIANITGTDVQGLQTAPLVNVAHHVKGVQFGLINVARGVEGAQIGLINIADSVDGASIGLISIVRHGYIHGEVWASETLPLNGAVKLGVQRYYTILGVAAEPFGNRVQWASGFGVGTAGKAHGRFTFSADLIQWSLAGTSEGIDVDNIGARLLTQFRPAVAWQIERQGHLQLVVAPTLNLALAWNSIGTPEWDFGSNQWLWIDQAGEQSRTRLWPGIHVGLRF
jgi:hypothetical protein